MESGITYHWFRNLTTADEAGYDLQINENTGKLNTFSFVWIYRFRSTDEKAPSKELKSKTEHSCDTITAAAYQKNYTDVVAAEKAKKEEADAKKKAADEAAKKKDWATQTTAGATALLAAAYALVF